MALDLTTLETEQVSRCILCDRHSPESDDRFYRMLALRGPYDVKRCPGCGLAWLSPRPTASAYGQLYSYESYFSGDDVVENYSDVACTREVQFRKRLETIKSMFHGAENLRLLDIGAATGGFVNEAIRLGFGADGIEISDGARAQAKELYGLDLRPGPLHDVVGQGIYEVIHMSHVLEHMPAPDATLAMCYRLLADGGVLVIEVPQQFDNDIDRIKYTFGLKKPEFNAYSLHHTYFFTPGNIEKLIRGSGFEVEWIVTANPSRTPLAPFKFTNLLLRCFLWLSDRIHKGGNIIEVYGRKRA